MSNLFIKFLPVEGGIKEGEKVLYNGKLLTTHYYDSHFTKWEFIEEAIPPVIYDNSLLKKVLPHLCSRDIQVGDKFFEEGDPTERTADTWEVAKSASTSSGFFKVLGLISPDAVWVTSGMEVKEKDVEEWWWSYRYNHAIMRKLPEDNEYDDNPLVDAIYKLRCPTCKTFH